MEHAVQTLFLAVLIFFQKLFSIAGCSGYVIGSPAQAI